MPGLSDLFPQEASGRSVVCKGLIATTPTGNETTVQVTIPSFDSNQRWGPCKFQYHINLNNSVQSPVRGDECLVVFDEGREAQLLTWWSNNPVPNATLWPSGGVNTQTTTSYTLSVADAAKMLIFNNVAAIDLAIPSDIVEEFPNKTVITFTQAGPGAVTITPSGGVTVNSQHGALKTTGQFAVVTLYKESANTWWAWGDLEVTPLPIVYGTKLRVRLPQSTGTRVFYVDAASGSDSNAGTSEAGAWATLQDYFSGTAGPANDIVPSSGDVVYVKNYPGQVASGSSSIGYRPGAGVDHVIDNKSGSANDPITVKAFPGHRPIILGPAELPGTTSRGLRVRNGSRYWRFETLEFPYASGTKDPEGNEPCVYLTGALTGNLEFFDCKIHGSTDGSGVLGEGGCHDVHFINTESWANNDTRYIDGAVATCNTTTGSATITITSGVKPSGASTIGSLVVGPGVPGGATVVSVAGDRFSYVISSPATLTQTGASITVFDHGAQSHSYYLNATKDWMMLNCIARDQANGYGYQIRNGAQGTIVAHCLAARIKGPGATFAGYLVEGGGSGTNNNKAINCVAYDTKRGWRQINTVATGNRAHDNLSFLASVAAYENQTAGQGWDWSPDESGNYDSPEGDNLNADPLFTSPGSNNWQPLSGSPLYGAGDPDYTPGFDYLLRTRVSATLGILIATEEL